MIDLYSLARPVLWRLDAEFAHRLAIAALRRGLVGRSAASPDPILRTKVWDFDFADPIGIAAGFDKNAEAIGPLFDLGFGFVEIGSVTPLPQAGNPRPRLFRLAADGAVINRMGFNSDGHAAVARRLAGATRRGVLGVNLGRNKDSADAVADYVAGVRTLGPWADYLVVNVSSPNTPGLRQLQDPEPLRRLLTAVCEARDGIAVERPVPVLLKIAPDLADDDLAQIATVALGVPVDGLIATNTTIDRPSGLTDPRKAEAGGLSGRPLFEPSTRVLGRLYDLTAGRLPLVGVGGVASGADAYAKIRAGASLVQLYTGLVYGGPGLVGDILVDLAALLRRDGFAALKDAVGADRR